VLSIQIGEDFMTYSSEIKELLTACDVETTIYTRKAVRAGGKICPLTMKQRRQVEKLSRERGYRRFVAEMMTTI
jgi:hypothetical protein